jgi:hypothetical protein
MTDTSIEELTRRINFYMEQLNVERQLRMALVEENELLQAEVRMLSEGIMDTLIQVTT